MRYPATKYAGGFRSSGYQRAIPLNPSGFDPRYFPFPRNPLDIVNDMMENLDLPKLPKMPKIKVPKIPKVRLPSLPYHVYLPIDPRLPLSRGQRRMLGRAGRFALGRLFPLLGFLQLLWDLYELLTHWEAISHDAIINPSAVNCGGGTHSPFQGPGYPDCNAKAGNINTGIGLYQKFAGPPARWVWFSKQQLFGMGLLTHRQGVPYSCTFPESMAPGFLIPRAHMPPGLLAPDVRFRPLPLTWRMPALDPEARKPGAVMGVPLPIPYKAIPKRPIDRPDRAPSQRSTRGYYAPRPVEQTRPIAPRIPSTVRPVVVRSQTDERRVISVVEYIPSLDTPDDRPQERSKGLAPPPPRVRGRAIPETVPGRIDITKEGTRIIPVPHVQARPNAAVKERKAIMTLNSAVPGVQFFGFVTEFEDVVDAIYAALPKNRRAHFSDGTEKRADLAEKLSTIYREFQYVDLPRVLQNLLANQLEDAAIGIQGRVTKQINFLTGSSFGLGAVTAPVLKLKG